MTALFNRQISLVVTDSSGNGLELSGTLPLTSTGPQPLSSGFHIVFRVESWNTGTPNALNLRIYNLNNATAQQIQNEFTRVVLRAGYPGNFGILFDGTITHIKRGAVNSDLGDLDGVRSGNENASDTYVDIFASDGDEAHNWGILNRTLAAGYTPAQVNDAIGQAMGAATTGPFSVGDLPSTTPQPQAPRGRVLYGMARDHADVLAKSYGLNWGIQNGALQWLPWSAYKPGDAVVLNSRTGLIGVPTQTPDGINVRSLLNPSIGLFSRVQINQKLIQQAAQSQAFGALNALPSVTSDGQYKVIWLAHTGDTRGTPWFTEFVCVSIDPSAIGPLGGKVLGVGAGPGS
jgi:hypothetical protein